MIILNLQCREAHPFEGWFDSVEDFDRQATSGSLTCPLCGDAHVARLPSAPRVRKSESDRSDHPAREIMARMMRGFAEMARNSEDVAERFPEEARRMHYGEAEPRNIRGQATLTETRELLEEGIAVLPVPVPPKENIH